MRNMTPFRKWLMFVCMFAVVFCGCEAAPEKSVLDMGGFKSSGSSIQTPRARAELPAFLDDRESVEGNDELVDERVHSRRSGVTGRGFSRLLLLCCVLAGLFALFAYLSAGVFHGSACPTYGLLRILSFIDQSDGQKERLFS